VLCTLCQRAPIGAGPGGSARRRGVRGRRRALAARLLPGHAHPARSALILDWSHLHHRGYQVATQVCRDKPTRLRFLGAMGRLLWHGDVDGAIAAAEEFRAEAKAPPDPRLPAPLDEWITYLDARRPSIPC